MKQQILVVDDEENVAYLVASALQFDGYAVRTAATGRAALGAVVESPPDLVVLDIMLGDGTGEGAEGELDGFEVLHRLRDAGFTVPVVFLSARDTPADRVACLRAGADDYVVKPFSVEELLERVRAVLRRAAPWPPMHDALLRVADLELDEPGHEVRRGGVEVALTATEFELLRLLMRNERVVLPKSLILERVWNYDFHGNTNAVETYIGYLRKKIDNKQPKLIHTVRGVGYVLKAP